MPEPLQIRRTSEADLTSLHHVLDSVARERRWLARTCAPSLEDFGNYRRSLWEADDVDLVASTPSGKIVGWVDVRREPWEGMRHVGVLGMGLLPAYRGQGLGRRLLQTALKAARDVGMIRIELEVYASNESAVALYRALGFAEEGCKQKARVLDGIEEDLLLMARMLADDSDLGTAPMP